MDKSGTGKAEENATKPCCISVAVMLSLTVLIAAALLTSSCAVLGFPRSAPGTRLGKTFSNSTLFQVCTGIVALGSVLLAVHIQWGVFR